MDHDFSLIFTFVGGLTAALLFGLIARKLHLSPLVGYLLAGVVVGPYSPGFVADSHTVEQFAELGVILLMFGVGLHFHLKDLIAVQRVAVPGAVVQISVATVLGVLVGWMFGWSTISGLVFGMAISVASTVVLTRVLEDNQNLHTPSGHVALGWLVVEDLFTILLLVLIPAVMEARQSGAGDWSGILYELGWMFVKLSLLVALTLFAGKKIIPLVLRYVARFDANGKARVGVEAVREDHPLASLLPCDNVFAIESRWYRDNPLVIRGPGAGRDVTAGAIQSDINRLAQLL